MTTVAAVVPHWNRKDLLTNLLDSLKRQTLPFDEIIVVDNGSTDGSPELAEQSGARVLRMERNYGFAAAVNRGIETASSDWIAILNNDVTLDPAWLGTLIGAAAREQAWFACGKVLRADNTAMIDATFDEVSRGACAWRCGAGRPDSPIWNKPRTIRMAPMTAALFRRQLFQEIETLDEVFESYLEDVDFGIRCACAGRSGVYEPAAVARHIGSATSGEWNKDTVRRIARNQVLLARKHYGGFAVWPMLAGQLLWGMVACRHGRALSYLRGKLQGLFYGFASQPKTIGLTTVKSVVEESERHIFELQRQTGFDLYWRAYFWLSRQ